MNNIGKHYVHLKGEDFPRTMTVYKYGGKNKCFVHKPNTTGGTQRIYVERLTDDMDDNYMHRYREVTE